MDSSGGSGDSKAPTTAPPPFDPEQFARESEVALRAADAPELLSTQKLPTAPPLDKRVRLGVPPEELAWFGLSPMAATLAGRIDGKKTLLELMEGSRSEEMLEAVAQLHDAGLLEYGN
jgi:hypothetical protein